MLSKRFATLMIASGLALPTAIFLLLNGQAATAAEKHLSEEIVEEITESAVPVEGDPVVTQPLESQEVTIQFAGMVGDQPFACGETYQLGTTSREMAPRDFRLYVSEVALIETETGAAVPLVLEQDGLWQHQNVALLDFEDKTGSCANGTSETRAQVIGSVPAGDYSGVTFTVGVPFALNHIDSTLAPSPLNLTSMWWSWNFGYKFVRLDLTALPDVAGTTDTQDVIQATTAKVETEADTTEAAEIDRSRAFSIHLGSVGCQMDSAQAPVACAVPNRPEVSLPDFDPEQNVVVLDLAALLADSNLSQNQEGTAVGCMSSPTDADCRGIMQNTGLPFQEMPAGEQTVFSVR